MDGKRFDHFTILLSSGSSRRSALKGLLGIGGAAATGALLPKDTDARTIGTRPTIPPPSPPSCALPRQMCGGVCCDAGKCKNNHCCPNTTDVWCGNACCTSELCTSDGDCCAAGQQVCGAVCCPATASCARNGNQDICCDPAAGDVPCGLECCDDPLQCCDQECCGSDDVCLARVFGEVGGIEEEVCCPIGLTCDGQCCTGECFIPFGSEGGIGPFDRSCCPADATCPYLNDLAIGLCCQGDTSECCHLEDGTPACLTPDQCCDDSECFEFTDTSQCLLGVCVDFTCVAQYVCDEETEICCAHSGGLCCPLTRPCCNDVLCCFDEALSCCVFDLNGVEVTRCTNLQESIVHCGECENACNQDLCEQCDAGACVDRCLEQELECDGLGDCVEPAAATTTTTQAPIITTTT